MAGNTGKRVLFSIIVLTKLVTFASTAPAAVRNEVKDAWEMHYEKLQVHLRHPDSYLWMGMEDCEEIYIPSAFSPNTDDQNDHFYVMDGGDVEEVLLFQVFDRWGNLIFRSKGYDNPWDGKQPDGKIQLGTYLYRIFLGEGKKPRTGKVTVLQ